MVTLLFFLSAFLVLQSVEYVQSQGGSGMASLSKGRDIHKRGFSLFSKGQLIVKRPLLSLFEPKYQLFKDFCPSF